MSEQISLFYKDGNSDKQYNASIEPCDGKFIVNFAYGRRGSTLTTGTKTPAPVDLDKAKKIFDKLVAEKTGKGYTPVEGATKYQTTDKAFTGITPQLLNYIDEEDADIYITNDAWIMQEKFDGKRMFILKKGDEVTGINRKGLTIGIPEAFVEAAREIEGNFLIDGEACGQVFHAFDILEAGKLDFRTLGYVDRAMNLMATGFTGAIKPVTSAVSTAKKRAMFAKMKKARKEGVVFKNVNAPYIAGRPNSGGSQLKVKFYATCSCVVIGSLRGGKRSVALKLFDETIMEEPGRWKQVGVGNVTIPPNFDIPTEGQVVEIRYLYAYQGGALYQPIYQGVRDDIDAMECLIDQLKYKAGEE